MLSRNASHNQSANETRRPASPCLPAMPLPRLHAEGEGRDYQQIISRWGGGVKTLLTGTAHRRCRADPLSQIGGGEVVHILD